MFRVVRPTLLGAMLFTVAVGCKKKDTAPTGGSNEPVTPGTGQPNPTPNGKKEPPKDDVEGTLAELRAKADDFNPQARSAAFVRLQKTLPPTHPRRADAFRTLVELAEKVTHTSHRDQILVVLPTYAMPDDIPALVALVNKDKHLHSTVANRLKELKDPRCAVDVAKWWATIRITGKPDPEAREILKAIGPSAQAAVLAYAKPELEPGKPTSVELREAAIMLLRDIGTEESVPTLKALLNDPSTVVRAQAKTTIAAIEARAGKGKS